MKSILQSLLLYACITKMQRLDDRSKEIIRSYIYTYWLLRFSGASNQEKFGTRVALYDLWVMTLEILGENGWTPQHRLVAEEFLSQSLTATMDSLERMSKISTVPIDLEEAKTAVNDVFQERSHSFGNRLTWELSPGA